MFDSSLAVCKLQTLLLPALWVSLALIGVMYRSEHNVSHIILKTVLKMRIPWFCWHVRCKVLCLHFYMHRSALQPEVFKILGNITLCWHPKSNTFTASRMVLFEDICYFENSFFFSTSPPFALPTWKFLVSLLAKELVWANVSKKPIARSVGGSLSVSVVYQWYWISFCNAHMCATAVAAENFLAWTAYQNCTINFWF